ncbi:hypothetical protein [Elizabethkingia miricola]|uniref:hypothetical protein n=1 Tax=Elizabethkingia miricola TaxID=172045 RepID=UPI0038918845
MNTIETIRQLLDEMPVIAEISNDMPFPYKIIIEQKTKEFNAYLEEIHEIEIEIEKHSNTIENFTRDLSNITEVDQRKSPTANINTKLHTNAKH